MSRRKDRGGQLDKHLVRQTDRGTNRKANGQTKRKKRTVRQTLRKADIWADEKTVADS